MFVTVSGLSGNPPVVRTCVVFTWGEGWTKKHTNQSDLPHRSVKRSSYDMDTCTEPLTRSEKEKSSKCVRYTYIIKKEEGKKHYLVNNCQPSITCQKVISQFMVHILLDTNLPGGPTVHSITESNVRFLTSRKHLTLVLFLEHVPL